MPRPVNSMTREGLSSGMQSHANVSDHSAHSMEWWKRPFRLWVDGVGAYLVCCGERVRLGGQANQDESAEISWLADLSRIQGTFIRSGEWYLLEPAGSAPVTLDGNPVWQTVVLPESCLLTFGNVMVSVSRPSPLSRTARLVGQSGHRLRQPADAVLLMDQTCLLGSGPDSHIICRDWEESVLLFVRGQELWCKSRGEIAINQQMIPQGGALKPGDLVSGRDFSFRVESPG